jgi:hypothetical protein
VAVTSSENEPHLLLIVLRMNTLKKILMKRGETRTMEGTLEYNSRPAKNNRLQPK